MQSIKILPPEVADQIAAGEVVERPSSVIKELIENSLDAGASRIEIDIEGGGRRLMRVTDDGHGMNAEDLRLSVQRHATSKIRMAEELVGVRSFGFRGEALPSIASVSRVEIQTKSEGSEQGWHLKVDGGKAADPEPDGWAKGTRVTVRELFFNTPARAKFLKADSTETQRLQQSLARLALTRPGVGFFLRSGKKSIAKYPACNHLKERITQVMGATFLDTAVEVKAQQGALSLAGWISAPDKHRGNRGGQHWIVNGRWVEHRLLNFHLGQGYGGTIPGGRYPSAMLELKVNDAELDVNVHPAKREVRFSDEKAVFDFLRRSVRQALNAAGYTSVMALPKQAAVELRDSAALEATSLHGIRSTAVSEATAPHQAETGWTRPQEIKGDKPYPAPLAQLHRSYILCQDEKGLLLVDQHAAHERVNYERIIKSVKSGGLESQNLLLPQKLSLAQGQGERLRTWIPALQEMGLEINDMGGGDFFVNAIPVLLKDVQVKALIEDLMDELGEEIRPDPHGPFLEKTAANIACKASIKANHPLTFDEMRVLVRDLFQCETPWDPHGRPASALIRLEDLEKHFHR